MYWYSFSLSEVCVWATKFLELVKKDSKACRGYYREIIYLQVVIFIVIIIIIIMTIIIFIIIIVINIGISTNSFAKLKSDSLWSGSSIFLSHLKL